MLKLGKVGKLLLFIILVSCARGALGDLESCTFKAWAGDGHQSAVLLPMKVCPSAWEVSSTGNQEISQGQRSRSTDRVFIDYLNAYWIPSEVSADRLLLNVTMQVEGRGNFDLSLIASSRVFPVFCGVIAKGSEANESSTVMVQLKCLEDDMQLDDIMTLMAKPHGLGPKRSRLPTRVNVNLPGCSLNSFQRSKLCRLKKEKKIGFTIKREGTKRNPIIKVSLFKDAYRSKVVSRSVAKTRRYNLLIHENTYKHGVWGANVRQHHEIRYPKRFVRFKYLKPKTTYVITVWRRGEGQKIKREITLC